MDVRNWGLGQIMQLPDHCFGRRWPIGLCAEIEPGVTSFDISEAALPEICVIWEIMMTMFSGAVMSFETGLSLGDHLPATDAEFAAFEPVFSGINSINSGIGHLMSTRFTGFMLSWIRQPLRVSGRRLVGRFSIPAESTGSVQLVIVVSGIPTEVPDCLLSV